MKFAIAVLTVLVLGAESRTYDHNLTLEAGVFDVYFTYESDMVYFKVVANTTGWVGLGLSKEQGSEDMENYDIALGGVRGNGQTYISDYWSTKKGMPALDTEQSFTLVSATEANGKTTFEFSRKADTGDTSHDVKIEDGKQVYLAWAIGAVDPTNMTNIAKHGSKYRGKPKLGAVLYIASNETTTTAAPTNSTTVTTAETSTTSSAAGFVPSIIVLSLAVLYHFMG